MGSAKGGGKCGVPSAEATAGLSAGYHGYWITDFLNVDPHLGTREEFRRLVDEAHARGMKVYMDIITNHTADVIAYRECLDDSYEGPDRAGRRCPYRSIADYPWTTRGGPDGEPIDPGLEEGDVALSSPPCSRRSAAAPETRSGSSRDGRLVSQGPPRRGSATRSLTDSPLTPTASTNNPRLLP